MEIHHIDPNGSDNEDNGIPLCFDCHADVRAYDPAHPKGKKFTPSELRKHRNQWFAIASVSPFNVAPRSTTGTLREQNKGKKEDYRSIYQYEDNRVFIFEKEPSISRTAKKKGFLANLANIPVFLPEFTKWSSPPHAFDYQSIYVTSRPPCQGEPAQFEAFINEIEQKWSDGYLRQVDDTLSWSISEDSRFAYGCGGENLIATLRDHERASIGGVLQGNFGQHYDRVFFLVLYGYKKGHRVLDIGADFYLRNVPVDWSWFQEIYDAFRQFNEDVRVVHYSTRELPLLSWYPVERKMITPEIIGGLRREGYGSSKEYRESDSYAGAIIDNGSLNVDYSVSTETETAKSFLDSFSKSFVLELLDESVISITNPVPTCDEVEAKGLELLAPSVQMMIFDAYGGTIYGISVHSGM